MENGSFWIVDVFAERPFAGNRLAVVRASEDMSAETMQDIAQEFNFSETTFILSEEAGDSGYPVRIFTPRAEVPFAGHPTLGTAWVIHREIARNPAKTLTLNLKKGSIPVSFQYDGRMPSILTMEQGEPIFGEMHEAKHFAGALGIAHEQFGSRYPVQEVSTGLPFIIVPVDNINTLNAISIDLARYYEIIGDIEAKALLVFCLEARDSENHISMRMFADYYGIPEDPATGSAAGCLAGYLSKHRILGSGSVDVRAEQGHALGRPSVLFLKANENQGKIEVSVGGSVVPVASGMLVAHKSA